MMPAQALRATKLTIRAMAMLWLMLVVTQPLASTSCSPDEEGSTEWCEPL